MQDENCFYYNFSGREGTWDVKIQEFIKQWGTMI